MIVSGARAASRFLTQVPVPGPIDEAGQLSLALAWFPVIGLILGAALAALDLSLLASLAHPLRDVLVVAALAALTGGMHLDGLSDTLDGLAQPSIKRAREVMRASAATPAGVAACVLALTLQVSCLASLAESGRTAWIALFPMIGRWAVGLAYGLFAPGPSAGPATQALRAGAAVPVTVVSTVGVAAVAAAIAGWAGLGACLAVALAVVLGAFAIRRRLGELTGDHYGAAAILGETVGLLTGAIVLPAA